MREIAAEGRTMIVVTHEMGFAREVSNHVVFLHQGLIEETRRPARGAVENRKANGSPGFQRQPKIAF